MSGVCHKCAFKANGAAPLLGFGDLAYIDDNRINLKELGPTFHIFALIIVGEFLALFQASEILLKS